LGGAGVLCAAVVFGTAGGSARAQSNNPCVFTDPSGVEHLRCLETQLFLPTPNIGTTFTIDTPSVPRHLSFVFGASLSFANGPLTRGSPDPASPGGTINEKVVDWLGQGELMAAFGLFEFIEIGLVVPFVIASVANDELAGPGQLGAEGYHLAGPLSDLRAMVKVPILRGDFALSVRGVFTFPTGDSQNFLSTGYWTAYPAVVMAGTVGPITIGGEIGYRLRTRAFLAGLEQDDELQAMVGVNAEITEGLAAIGELQLRAGLGGRTLEWNEVPTDLNLGVRITPSPGFAIDVGGGTGLGAGYGAPAGRGFVIVRYATATEGCEHGPEDFDGFEDGDFCADLDNDADGIEDAEDDCENDAEDVDQFRDADGCPDPDNDADGIPDGSDQCPLQTEDIDGVEDEDGCPDEDNDQDGLPDGVDQCRNDPEDRDNFQDDDGCPEPGPETAQITVTDTRILISERIYFDFDRDTIRSVSQPLLDQVAGVIQQLPANKRIRVEGYTDTEGVEQYNTDLSYRRARAVVEYLSGRGVPRARLEYVGYGERNPVAPNDTPDGRALNRRVEFTILEAGERGRRPR
jgi:outer membrane protein OmpA-like peptidoglycan-associated protein